MSNHDAAPLVAPVLSPSGTVHFVSVREDATVGDALNALSQMEDVKEDILGHLPEGEHGWALQTVLKSESGRQWEEDELENLGDGE